MLHPSYLELMEAVNKNSGSDEPVVTSRYSVVLAAAKRARQIIEERSGEEEVEDKRKPLSIAIDELVSGQVKVLPNDKDPFEGLDEEELADSFLDDFDDDQDFDDEDADYEDDDFEEEDEDAQEDISEDDVDEEAEDAGSDDDYE